MFTSVEKELATKVSLLISLTIGLPFDVVSKVIKGSSIEKIYGVLSQLTKVIDFHAKFCGFNKNIRLDLQSVYILKSKANVYVLSYKPFEDVVKVYEDQIVSVSEETIENNETCT